MFSNLLDLVSRRGRRDYSRAFVREVNLRRDPERDRRFERLLWIFWGVIVVKCVLVWWLMRHYAMPFSPLWVVLPTLMFAGLCTLVYIWRD